jgi:hypothetical protein
MAREGIVDREQRDVRKEQTQVRKSQIPALTRRERLEIQYSTSEQQRLLRAVDLVLYLSYVEADCPLQERPHLTASLCATEGEPARP